MKKFLPRNPVWHDFVLCLSLWFVLEIVCFAIGNAIAVAPVKIQPQQLFVLSILLGIGGACLMASSTQISLSWATPGASRQRKRLMWIATQALSWLGLIGIAFPLLILSFQIVMRIFAPLRT